MAKPTGTATPNGDKPLLDLSTLDKVEYINIDGQRFDLVNLDALALRPRNRLATAFTRCLELIARDADQAAKPLTKREERELAHGVKALVPMLVPGITPEAMAKLTAYQQQEIVLAFFVIRSENAGRSSATQRMIAVTNGLTGASSSPGSNASTAAPSKIGTTASRRGSSPRT